MQVQQNVYVSYDRLTDRKNMYETDRHSQICRPKYIQHRDMHQIQFIS